MTTPPAPMNESTPQPPALPEWFSKPHRHPDYCDPCCDDTEALLKWQFAHVAMLEKLVKELAARALPPGSQHLESQSNVGTPSPKGEPLDRDGWDAYTRAIRLLESLKERLDYLEHHGMYTDAMEKDHRRIGAFLMAESKGEPLEGRSDLVGSTEAVPPLNAGDK